MWKDEFDVKCLDYILTSDILTDAEKICIEDSTLSRTFCEECDNRVCEQGFTTVEWENPVTCMEIKMTVSHMRYTAGISITTKAYLKMILLEVVDGEIRHSVQYSTI